MDIWFRLGVCNQAGMGLTGVGWAEIDAFCRLTGTPLKAWDAEVLFMMSAAYASQFAVSADPDCEPPWLPAGVKLKKKKDKDDLQSVESAFNSLASKKRGNGGLRHN